MLGSCMMDAPTVSEIASWIKHWAPYWRIYSWHKKKIEKQSRSLQPIFVDVLCVADEGRKRSNTLEEFRRAYNPLDFMTEVKTKNKLPHIRKHVHSRTYVGKKDAEWSIHEFSRFHQGKSSSMSNFRSPKYILAWSSGARTEVRTTIVLRKSLFGSRLSIIWS